MPFKSNKTDITFSLDETIFDNVLVGKEEKIPLHGLCLAQSNESDTYPGLENVQGKQLHQPQTMSDFPDWCTLIWCQITWHQPSRILRHSKHWLFNFLPIASDPSILGQYDQCFPRWGQLQKVKTIGHFSPPKFTSPILNCVNPSISCVNIHMSI